jgi:hypothetical protein
MLGALNTVVNTSKPIDPDSALQTTALVRTIVGAPGEVTGNTSVLASSMASSVLTSLLNTNPQWPLHPDMMVSALGVSSNLLHPTAQGALTTTQAASVAGATAGLVDTLAAGALTNVLPGQAPVVVKTATITVASQRNPSSSLFNSSQGLPAVANSTAASANVAV